MKYMSHITSPVVSTQGAEVKRFISCFKTSPVVSTQGAGVKKFIPCFFIEMAINANFYLYRWF